MSRLSSCLLNPVHLSGVVYTIVIDRTEGKYKHKGDDGDETAYNIFNGIAVFIRLGNG
jgi:hypothetical protein